MMRSVLVLATLGAVIAVLPVPSAAADLSVPGPPTAVSPQAQGPNCGPCGCLTVTYDYHRELRSTYGAGFDPRNYDESEPHFYFGPMRAYPRYALNGCQGPY